MYNKITEKKFKAVKILFDGGATIKEVAEYLEISASSASRIKSAETYEDYLQGCRVRSYYQKQRNKKQEEPAPAPVEEVPEPAPVQVVEHRQSVTIQATHYMMVELQKTNELLTTISAKLAFIVDELTGT